MFAGFIFINYLMPAGMFCGGRFRYFCLRTVFGKTKNTWKYFSGCGCTV